MLENKKYSKNISDAAWSTLIRYTTAKAESAGRVMILREKETNGFNRWRNFRISFLKIVLAHFK
jgi:hypothetical protein